VFREAVKDYRDVLGKDGSAVYRKLAEAELEKQASSSSPGV